MSSKISIGVVGAGAMGHGIAQVAAQAGHEVWLYDKDPQALERAESKLKSIFDRLVEKGKVSSDDAQRVLSRIQGVSDMMALKDSGLVIEAIVERLEIKQSVFQSLEAIVSPETVLASNTSSLSIASIGAGLANPDRLMGIHFFNPPALMPLVEIVPSMTTDPEVAVRMRTLVDSWGKTTVLARDTPGFIVNRVARPFYSEAIVLYEEGVADYATIDWALRTVGGFRMGPFELTDLIGHDVNYIVTETVWKQFFYDPRFRPSISQKRLYEAGMFGKKTGRGWYDYRPEAKNPEPVEDMELARFITDRIVTLLINEAADAVHKGIGTVEDIDLAMTRGVNYPKGLLAWADEIGIAEVLQRLEKLHGDCGDDRYRPNLLLRKMAAGGETFYGG